MTTHGRSENKKGEAHTMTRPKVIHECSALPLITDRRRGGRQTQRSIPKASAHLADRGARAQHNTGSLSISIARIIARARARKSVSASLTRPSALFPLPRERLAISRRPAGKRKRIYPKNSECPRAPNQCAGARERGRVEKRAGSAL